MYKIKSMDVGKNTYYCGYITNYERTEAEKAERNYMIVQKLIGFVALVLAALSLLIVENIPEVGIFTLIMGLIGIVLILTKEHAFSYRGL